MLMIYVYGTLKHGFWNHDRYCKGVVEVTEGEVLGRLFELATGIPILEVPDNLVLAEGTRDPRGDARLQREAAGESWEGLLSPPDEPSHTPEYGWGRVKGEIMHFNDPLLRLPPMDHLEGYKPGDACHCRRLLYPARSGGCLVPVWLYAGDAARARVPRFPLRSGRWPS
jgi:gamma-glutamylcyclotransferase (GGCT)/AIG2-like uncharacterized protein YtfP